METNLERRVIDLTGNELLELIKSGIPPQTIPVKENDQKKFAYSIREGADHFNCSYVTFQSWKNKGFVVYVQHGRKLIIDLIATMELLKAKTRKRL